MEASPEPDEGRTDPETGEGTAHEAAEPASVERTEDAGGAESADSDAESSAESGRAGPAGRDADSLVGPAGDTAELEVAGKPAAVRYRVVEASSLDTGGAGDEASVARMRAGIVPSMLGASDTADRGAPVIGEAGTVEAGASRAVALRRAYKAGTADPYRAWLVSHAGEFGLEAADVEQLRQPVLVRARLR